MSARIHCQVLEAPTHEWMPRGGLSHRELLPWADPYIALLMQRLEERFDANDAADLDQRSVDLSRRFDGPANLPDDCGDDEGKASQFWNEPPEESSASRLPAVYGGWPLLDDVQETSYDTF